jgi:hypothetical protein
VIPQVGISPHSAPTGIDLNKMSAADLLAAIQGLRRTNRSTISEKVVAGGGIEPPTQSRRIRNRQLFNISLIYLEY